MILPNYLHLDRPAVEKMKPKELYPVILALQTELVKTQMALSQVQHIKAS